MSAHEVVIAGGGPTGLMLAAELRLAGVDDVVIIEPRRTQEVDGSRAGGLLARTIEVLDHRDVAPRFLDAGQVMQVHGFAYIPLDISDFPTRHPYGLALRQSDIERILAEWVLDELGIPILRERAVVAFEQTDRLVDVELADGASLQAQFLVGCDGGRSTVRKAAGIDFPGVDASTSFVIAEVEMTENPPIGIRPGGGGIGPANRLQDSGPFRVVLKEQRVGLDREPTLQDLRDTLIAADGTDYGVHNPSWISRFTDMARQASAYRAGRVLLAGDAAHVHSPHGGQGLNTGVQDAVNLGWKLAQVVLGISGDELLDTYHAERHPVGARVLQNTMAQVALTVDDPRHRALHDIVADLLGTDQGRHRTAGMMSGLDIAYDLDADDPVVGRRMPDLDLATPWGATRVFELLHDARPVLMNLGAPVALDVPERVRVVEARIEGDTWTLPVIGEVAAPGAVLIRPDGHVAWAGEPTDPALRQALTRWFGEPATATS